MYLPAVVLLSCLTLSYAEATCGPLEKVMVKRQWASVYSVGDNRQRLATQVWRDFFRRHGDEVKRFERVNGANVYSTVFRAHMLRVFAGFDLLISSLPDEAVFNSVLAHYSKMHVDLGVTTDIVLEFGKSLGYVLPDFLEDTFALDAWRPCFQLIAKGVSKA